MAEHDHDENAIAYEREVLLTEYKLHHEEIFKWNSYANQSVAGYFAVFSIIATIIGKKDGVTEIVLFVIMYASLALLYIIFQYHFNIDNHNKYILKHLASRIQKLSKQSNVVEWESFVVKARDKAHSTWNIRLLTKFGTNIVPYIVIPVVWIWYFSIFLCEDLRLICDGSICDGLFSTIHVVLGFLMPIPLFIWLLYGFHVRSCDTQKLVEEQRH